VNIILITIGSSLTASRHSLKRFIAYIVFLFAMLLSMSVLAQEQMDKEEVPIDIGLTIQEKTWLTFHPKIRIAPDQSYEPVEFVRDSQHSGMTSDYFNLLEEKLGIEFILSSKNTWSESLEALEKAEVDLVPIIQRTPERAKLFNFTQPYLNLNTVIIASNPRQDKDFKITDFNGKRIAVVEGYFWNELLPIDYPMVELVTVPEMVVGLQATALGTVDAFLGSFATASHYITVNDITNLHVAGRAPYQIEYASAVRKDWPELSSILSKAFKSITPEEHASIRSKWIKLSYEPPLVSTRTTKVVFGLLGLTAL